ncbi:hypothetical protein FSC37_09195 [Piscinibacter aquaticus]|uniref:Uncharacterized protein n=1 Tax=Piscinibacter aquaticus TaxID=392597 RepID=A0A5C6TZD0_9BURK|nr:hypothetical protein FSC37_09195 [Piscinibacter aquaticus]
MNDAGGGVIGSGTVDNSLSYQQFTDSRNQSTTVVTDGGAFDVVRSVADGLSRIGLAQTDAAREIATRADAAGNSAMTFAMRAQQDAAGFNELAASKSFDLARSSAAQAFASSGEAIGFTRDTFGRW